MEWGSSAFLGFAALGFLVLLLVGKMLTVYELRSQDKVYRKNLHKISEIESDLESSRRKYLIALKAGGVAKNRVSQLKTRLATVKQHAEQLAMTAAQEAARKEQEKERVLEKAVLDAMGGAAHRDSHFLLRKRQKITKKLRFGAFLYLQVQLWCIFERSEIRYRSIKKENSYGFWPGRLCLRCARKLVDTA